MEPECKRFKYNTENPNKYHLNFNHKNSCIKSILSTDYTKSISTEQVYISSIADMRNISAIITELNHCLPINSLQHLKRARKNEILLSRMENIINFVENNLFSNTKLVATNDKMLEDEYTKLQQSLMTKNKNDLIELIVNGNKVDTELKKNIIYCFLIWSGLSSNIVKILIDKIYMKKVAVSGPFMRWQYEEMNNLWPCKYHPNKRLEKLYSNNYFSPEESDLHLKFASISLFLSKENGEKHFGICVDPRTNSIVAVAGEMIDRNPIMHCSMVLIDMVARTQNGGAYMYPEKYPENHSEFNFQGIEEKYLKSIKKHFLDIRFGAEMITNDRKFMIPELIEPEMDNLKKYGPYICTGYDVYLSHEPCLMCAMALTHSRVKRLFYIEPTIYGGLETRVMLHTVRELNHHYEVYKMEFQPSSQDCYTNEEK